MSGLPDVLDGVTTAACFFCAAFLGENVEQYIRDGSDAVAVCIDIDSERIEQMRGCYPDDRFHFVVADAFDELERMQGQRFDLVTVDPFTGAMPLCYSLLPKWRALGVRVLLGITPEQVEQATADGAQCFERSPIAWWALWT